ncbi:hypothetical protein COJ96_22745 [Bacillus sp. AFS073361]|nr:hypothetical protein COJ96_22745 [Bacillus sp. AFS073361]
MVPKFESDYLKKKSLFIGFLIGMIKWRDKVFTLKDQTNGKIYFKIIQLYKIIMKPSMFLEFEKGDENMNISKSLFENSILNTKIRGEGQ